MATMKEMAKDRVFEKLLEHDKRLDRHNQQFAAVMEALSDFRIEMNDFRSEFNDFRSDIFTKLDKLIVGVERLDTERLVSVHRVDELTEDVRLLETSTGFSRQK